MKKRKYISMILILLISWGLIFYTKEIGIGIRNGIENCIMLLIPSLFPFMIFAAILGNINVSGSFGITYIMSLLGGYPVGAQMISQQLKRNEIDIDTATRRLCSCVNAGVGFLIGTIGMLLSPQAGILLLIAQILSSSFIGIMQLHKNSNKSVLIVPTSINPQIIVESISNATWGMIRICGFVIAFSGFTALLNTCGLIAKIGGFIPVIIAGIFEVTNGCIIASKLPEGLILIAFFISFSSLSIIFQIKSYFTEAINWKRFYISRIIHSIITCIIVYLGKGYLPEITVVKMLVKETILYTTPNRIVSGICIIGMISIILCTSSSPIVKLRLPTK